MMYNNFHMGIIGFPGMSLWLLIGLAWVIGIKGYALWHAGKRNEPWWFFFLLIINTMGVLELFYLIFIAKVLFGKKHHGHSM